MQQNTNKTIINSKVRDSGSKIIFEDNTLCSQFLRDYIDLPYLKDVRPEDIEDVSEQFVPLFEEERNADRVKRVNIHGENPFFLVSLIEHKTKIDYNVCMQVFRYMVFIWDAYEKEAEKKQKGISKRASFRYPVILPIVYYEGSDKWAAPLDFKNRVEHGEEFGKYVPDFQYYLVPLHDYNNEELLDKADEISLIMLINKLQSQKDIEEFRKLPAERLEHILQETPKNLLDIIANVLLALLLKQNVPVPEAEVLVGKVKEKKMAELFENMEKIDVQAARLELAEEKKELAEEKKELAEEKKELAEEKKELAEEKKELAELKEVISRGQEELSRGQEELSKGQEELANAKTTVTKEREEGFKLLIESLQEIGLTKEDVLHKLQNRFQLDKQTAANKVEQFWIE